MKTLGQLKIEAARRPYATAFWHKQFPAGWEKTGFRGDRGEGTGRGRVELAIGAATSDALDRFGHGDATALHSLLTAAVAALLHRYTGAGRVAVGQPLTLDPDRAAEPLASAVPVLCAVDGGASLRSLTPPIAAAVAEAEKYHDYPFEVLADHLGLARPAGASPFFDVGVRLEGLHEAFAEPPAAVFDFARADAGLLLRFGYDRAVFSAAAAGRLAAHFGLLLDAMCAEPELASADVSLLGGDDRRLLDAVNDTGRELDDSVRFHEMFARRAAAAPDAVALRCAGVAHTYAELDAAANRLAWTLRERGVGRESVVAVMADRSFAMMAAILAVLKAGGAYLPVDPAHPAARIEYVLRDSRAALVCAQRAHAGKVPAGVDAVDLDDSASFDARSEAPPAVGDAADLMYVIYTSGSTGNPKGAAVEHRAALNRIAWMQHAYPIGAGDAILQKTPIAFDVSVWELFWWMREGASLSLLGPGDAGNPEAIIAAVESTGVTTMHFVPSMLAVFLEYVASAGAAGRLAGLRQVFASGEALSASLVREFHRLLAPNGTRLVNLYGPTEATVDVSHFPCDDPDPEAVPIGRPIENLRLYVVDERLRPLPPGIPGELCIAGTGLARGYLHRPELTAEKFVEAPFPGEDRVYRTGDLAQWLPDGNVEYLGRIDHQVKIRGYRIELGEIEAALADHPLVREAAVVVRTAGDGQVLHGYVTGGAAEADLAAYLRERLPEYMVPSRIAVIDAMPLSPNGKLDRKALPEIRRAGARRDAAAPREGTERVLAGIWCEALGIERVGTGDNFFSVGGDSIHFVVVLAKARRAGLNFTFQEFFAHPTIGELAAYLDARSEEAAVPESLEFAPFALVAEEDRDRLPEDAEDAYPLSMLQAGLIFQSEMIRGTAEYHDIITYLIQAPFDRERFEQAVALAVERNPMLRTTYHLDGFRDYLQVVHRTAPAPLVVVDQRGMDTAAQQTWFEEWSAAEKAREFDWSRPGSLLTLHVQILGPELYRYNISLHNSCVDGWSINRVHAEVFDIYHRLRSGQEVEPATGANHQRDYVGLELRSLASAEDREFWAGRLREHPFTEIPALAPPGTPNEVVLSHFDIPLELSDAIQALADELAVPVKNVLMAAHLRVMAVISGDDDAATGYEHSGRPEAEGAERAIGMFLNTIPFRVDQGPGSWADLVRAVYRAETDLLPHRRYPMAKMKQDLGTQRTLFESTFNFTHFYLLKDLKRLPEFDLLNVLVQAETEFPLRCEVSRHFFHDNVRLSLHYHADRISEEQIRRIGGYYVRALELMTGDPGGEYTALSLLDGAELALVEDRFPRAAAGRFAPGAAVRVVDAHGMPSPVGTPGRIVVLDGPVPDGTSDGAADGGSASHERAFTGRAFTDTGERGRWTPAGELEVLEAPAEAPAAAPEAFAPPAGEAEERVAAAWEKVLGIPAEEIGRSDDFFDLGGNSLTAMRVTMGLDGAVSLIDVMEHPRLLDLAAILGSRSAEEGVLRPLTAAAGPPSATLVCFPYAAGHPSNFLDLAKAVAAAAPDIAVHAVEFPGHDPRFPGEPLTTIAETGRLVADDIAARIDGPVILWGHCFGAAAAVETCRLLEERGTDVRRLYLGAKLLNDADYLREAIEVAEGLTDDEIIAWLIDRTGFTEADGLEPDQRDFICRMFKHDSASGHRYFIDARERPEPVRLRTPVTFVGTGDDRLVAGYREAHRDWTQIAADVSLRELDAGGHYFARTRARDVAAFVAADHRSTDTPRR
ncbi:non-ribosomal peptide synthetase [Glycomyces albidus]|uniref:Amino acid adenylation domain-containing protein n=1 Tax=Glycomyces albidus TaxID=2656774 RepID=A0A6L5G743_9ACTN|nr:non-ribosomal peptide synthetase [Glycomyces albidus]MQM25462.1 amino acid adenylation domain-containing protein [Glycomyces albidus]